MTRSRLKHDRLWAAIDAMASRHGLTPSGLARRAGLDATALNKSKRFTGDGRPRWPSTESIAKILAATESGLDELVRLMLEDGTAPTGFGEEGREIGHAAAEGRDGAETVVVADADMTPIFRIGDLLIVSTAAPIAHSDRIVLRIGDGPPIARTLVGRTAKNLTIAPLDGRADAAETIALAQVAWMARIMWVRQ